MTKASDNIFPKLTLVEGSAPASPAASDFSLYFDSADHLLKWKNSAGTVTTLATGTAMTNPMTTAGDIILGDTGGAAIRLAKGTDSQVLTVDPTTHLPLWAAGGGGGGLAQSFVGYNTIGGTWTAVTSTRQINKKITLASAATLTSIDAHVRANSDGFQVMMVGLLTDNAGAPDLLCAVNYAGNMLLSNSSSGSPARRPVGERAIGYPRASRRLLARLVRHWHAMGHRQ